MLGVSAGEDTSTASWPASDGRNVSQLLLSRAG
jgi:hypothetical protein